MDIEEYDDQFDSYECPNEASARADAEEEGRIAEWYEGQEES